MKTLRLISFALFASFAVPLQAQRLIDNVTLGGANSVKSGATFEIASGATFTYTAGAAVGGSMSEFRTDIGLGIGTAVQAFDADLTTYAGITPSANVQSLLGAADYAVMRTQLGLVISTNVQAYDADLTTYAGITPSANVQTLLSAADYAAVRTSLALVPGTDILGLPASSAEGDILYRNGTAWTRLPKGTDGQVLKSTAATVAWGTDSEGSGSLPGSPTEGDTVYYDGAAWAKLAIGTAGQVLTVNSTADAPQWGAPPNFSVSLAATQSIANETFVAVAHDTEAWDTGAFWASSPNPTRITFTSATAGKWLINATLDYANNATGYRYLELSKNGGASFLDVNQVNSGGSFNAYMQASAIVSVVAGDYIELIAFQSSGGALNVRGSLSGFRIAP